MHWILSLFVITGLVGYSYANLQTHRVQQLLFQDYETARQDYHSKRLSLIGMFMRHHPEDMSLVVERGKLFDSLNRFEDAIQDFSQVIQSGQLSDEAHFRRARVYETIGRDEDALKDYQAVIARAESVSFINSDEKKYLLKTIRSRVTYFSSMGLETEGQKDLALLIKYSQGSDKDLVEAYQEKARFHHEFGQYHQALIDISQAIQLYERADIYYSYLRFTLYKEKGEYLLALKKYADAKATFTLMLEGELLEDYFENGTIYYLPDRQITRVDLADQFTNEAEMYDNDEVRWIYSWVANQYQPRASNHLNVGEYFFKNKHYIRAHLEFKQGIKLDPENIELARYYAHTALLRGDGQFLENYLQWKWLISSYKDENQIAADELIEQEEEMLEDIKHLKIESIYPEHYKKLQAELGII